MGLIWFIAAVLIWWLVGGIAGALGPHGSFDVWFGDFRLAASMTAFFFVGWWLPYVSLLAIGELFASLTYPSRKTPYVVFAVLSFAVYSALALYSPHGTEVWTVLIWPAAAVTLAYIIRRFARKAHVVG